ncbi:hypothetical protein TcWFU_000487 [Taenia crassiceps]|uniref:Uncharacterized protein n=1 Tax=Taenia crassiceps TaxID=6207 RepID=A0ABR4Q5A6_9CEST
MPCQDTGGHAVQTKCNGRFLITLLTLANKTQKVCLKVVRLSDEDRNHLMNIWNLERPSQSALDHCVGRLRPPRLKIRTSSASSKSLRTSTGHLHTTSTSSASAPGCSQNRLSLVDYAEVKSSDEG